MKVELDSGAVIEIGATESAPTIGITDYSRRETDDFGVTTVVQRGFARTMSVRVKVDTADVDTLQRQLAALRATPARWIADDRFDALSFTGYYKEFSLDLAIPPVSYCTLTIEGLADDLVYVDPGTDPATDGRQSSLRLLRPAAIDDAVLGAINVLENDYPAWSAATSYALGDRAILAATHRIYESAADANSGNDPTASALWIDIGPTNRWAMFDQALGSLTERANTIIVQLHPAEPVDAIALLDVTAGSVRVEGAGYDRTLTPATQPGSAIFLDLPAQAGSLIITISGSDTVSVGTLLIGNLLGLGTTEAAPTAAITDYSRKETNDFGEVTLVERAWAKRMEVRALISTSAVDVVAARIADVRATPALWIGDTALESLTIYGFFKDYSIEVGENVSTLSLSIEGLSEAASVAPIVSGDDITIPWENVSDPDGTRPEDNATVGATPAQVEQINDALFTAETAQVAIAAAQAQIVAIEGSVMADFSAINAEVEALHADLAAAQGGIISLQSATSDVQQSVSLLNADLANAQSTITTIQSSVGSLSSQIGTVQADLSALAADVGTVSGTVAGLSSQVGTVQADLSALAADVGTVSSTVTGLSSQIGTVTADVSGLTSRITSAEGQISATSTTVGVQGSLIQQNAQAISNVEGDLASLTTRVSASNSNLLPNGGLANGFATGVENAGNYSYANSQFWGPIAVTTQTGTQVFTFAPIPANPGSTYTVSCDPIAYTTDKLAYVDILFFNAGGQVIYDGPQNPLHGPFDFSASNTRRSTIAVSALAPFGTVSMCARFVGDGAGAGPVGFRRMKLEHGNQWTAFSDEASVVQTFLAISTAGQNIAQLTTTVAANTANISQQATAISSLQGTTASLSSTVSTQGGAISSLQTVTTTQGGTIAQHTSDISTANANISQNATAISTANGNIANLTTRVGSAESNITQNATAISNVSGRTATLEGAVSTQGASITSLQTATSTIGGNLATLTTRVSASSPNLLLNGGLENGFDTGINDSGGFGFYTGNWGPIASTTLNGLRVFTFTPYASPHIGAQYTFAVDPLNFGTSDIYANILCLNSSGGVILDPPAGGSGSAGDFSTNDVRRALMACTVTVPAGTASLLCRVYGTVRDGQPLGFRRAKLERGPTWTPYTAEASVVQTWTAINTATGSIASLTTRIGTAESNITQNATAISTVSGNLASLSSTVSTQGASITVLQSTASTLAGSLATLTTRVNASQVNLLANGGLENGFGSAAFGSFALVNSGAWGWVAATGLNGTQVFEFAPITSVQIGATYWISCDPLALGSSTIFCDLLFYNAAGDVILDGEQTILAGSFDFSSDDTRRGQIAASAVAPSGAVRIGARIVANVVGGQTVGFRRVKVETGPRWTPFSQEASVTSAWSALNTASSSLASLTTRVSTAEASVTTLQSSMTSANGSISTLQTNVASLNGSVSILQSSSSTQAGQISSLQSTVSAQGATIASNSTAISGIQGNLATLTTRVSASQSNLLANGGLENGFTGVASIGSFAWNNGAEWGATATTTTTGTQVFQFADITNIQPGATYWISCDPLAFGSSTIYCDLLFYDSSGNLLLDGGQNVQVGPFNFSSDDGRRGLIAVSAVAPSGAAIIKPRIIAEIAGNQIAGFRRVKVETGPTWSRFTSEASVVQQFQSLATLSSSYATLSTTVASQGGQVSNLQAAFTGLNGTVATLQTTVSAQGGSISTLQSVQSTLSGQISTLESKVVAGGGNLLQNTDFAVDLTAWTFQQVGTAHSGGRDLLGDNYRPLNEHTAGIYHSNSNGADYAYWQSQRVAIAEGKYYEFSVGAANSRANVMIYLRFLYGDGSAAADFTAARSTYSEGNLLINFPVLAARGLAPAGAWWCECLMLKSGTNPGFSDSYAWFVRPQLVEVPGLAGSPVAYSPGGTAAMVSIQAQAIGSANSQISSLSSTVSAQSAQVSNLQTAYTGLNGTVATLQTTVSAQAASISTLQSTTSTLQGNVATLTTRVSAAGPNLLPNGGLENGFGTGVGDTGGFTFATGTWGPQAIATTDGLRVFQFAPVGSIQIGAEYTFAVDPLNFGASDLYCNMVLLDSNGGVILDVPARSPQGSGDFSSNDIRRSQCACTATIPAGVALIVCRVYGTVRDGQPLGFRRAKLERGSTWTPYSAEASIVQQYQTLSTLSTQYASLSSTVSVHGASITQNATAISSINGQFASLSSTVLSLSSSVSTQQSAITDLQGRTSAYWQVTAVAGGRAQLTVHADANGGGGVDILGDLSVSGNALISGTVNPEALALDRFVRRVSGSGAGSPSAGQTLLLASMDLGTVTINGSYALTITGTFQTNVGRTTGTYNSKTLYTNTVADGGLLVQIVRADGVVVASYTVNGGQYAIETPSTRTISATNDLIFDAPANDDVAGNRTLRIYAIRGNADTGNVNNGDYYQRDISATYSNFSITAKLKWTFI